MSEEKVFTEIEIQAPVVKKPRIKLSQLKNLNSFMARRKQIEKVLQTVSRTTHRKCEIEISIESPIKFSVIDRMGHVIDDEDPIYMYVKSCMVEMLTEVLKMMDDSMPFDIEEEEDETEVKRSAKKKAVKKIDLEDDDDEWEDEDEEDEDEFDVEEYEDDDEDC